MKLHLRDARCWEVVDIGVNPLQNPNEWTLEDEIDFHLNATTSTLILQCLTPKDNNKVNSIVNAKQIWDTLKVSFEEDKSVTVGNNELIQSKTANFCMFEGEMTKAMFDRFMPLINQITALGAKTWDDNSGSRKICRVYVAPSFDKQNQALKYVHPGCPNTHIITNCKYIKVKYFITSQIHHSKLI